MPTNQNGIICSSHLHTVGWELYKRWPPLSLSGTQLKLLPESLAPVLKLFLLKQMLFYALLQSKINLGFQVFLGGSWSEQ